MTEANMLKRYIGRAGQMRCKVAPWMLDRQAAHIPVGLAISWLVFLWPLDLSSGVLWGSPVDGGTAVRRVHPLRGNRGLAHQRPGVPGHTGVRDRARSRGSGPSLANGVWVVVQFDTVTIVNEMQILLVFVKGGRR